MPRQCPFWYSPNLGEDHYYCARAEGHTGRHMDGYEKTWKEKGISQIPLGGILTDVPDTKSEKWERIPENDLPPDYDSIDIPNDDFQ